MRLPVCLVSLVVCLSLIGQAQTRPPAGTAAPTRGARAAAAPSAAPGRLAVRRVVLYKNGVGFFEHVGRVVGDEDVTVTFTSAQLDDALKSLTALDLGTGRVAGITYNSTAPLAQRLAGLPFTLSDKADHLELFRGVRGARVEVRAAGGAVVRGRLVAAEPVQPGYGSPLEATTMLTLVGDRGDVHSVRWDRRTPVRIADGDVAAGVTRYLSQVADDLRRDERRVTVAARGTGARDLYLSYVAEVPAWKSTYRLLMPSATRPEPLLQGWAVVDNTVGEDWRNVEMALVAGAPQSFVQRLSQPRYVPRAEMETPVEASLAPLAHDAALAGPPGLVTGVVRDRQGNPLPGASVSLEVAGTVVSRGTTGARGDYALNARPGVYRLTVELTGFTDDVQAVTLRAGRPTQADSILEVGMLQETITVTGEAPVLDVSMAGPAIAAPDSRTVEEQMAMALPQATAQPLGELFEYRISGPVTVGKNQSALVPILRSGIAADRVSLWNDGLGGARPLRAVWITNTTGLTLDGGTVSIVDGGAFGGEGTMETLVPGGRRLVSFARDLNVSVSATAASDRRTLVAIASADGALVERRETCARRTYTLANDDRTARTVVVEHPARRGWTLAGGATPVESTALVHRFRAVVPAGTTATLVVQEAFPSQFRYDAGQLTTAQVAAYVASDGLGADAAGTLGRLIDLRRTVVLVETDLRRVKEDGEAIAADQERVRANMEVLKGSAEERQLLQRYVRQLGDHENRLVALATEAQALEARRAEAQAAFDDAVRTVAVTLAAPGTACR